MYDGVDMAIHKSDPNRKPDSEFIPGELALLVPDNRCRLLDGRRTPGFIEVIDEVSGLFRWRITAFEDAGKSWDVPVENVTQYQFELSSAKNGTDRIRRLQQIANRFSKPLVIPADAAARAATEDEIRGLETKVDQWLDRESLFFAQKSGLDFRSRKGPPELALDLRRYLHAKSLWELEAKTAEAMVLNPDSGEWIKGMLIVLAEMGLVSYAGKIVRTPDLFDGIGATELRRRYSVHRLAFVRAVFRRAGHPEVVVYRGMASESDWQERARAITPCTFSLRVARAFADFDRGSSVRTSYLMKLTVPAEKLWITYCETEALNGRYLEAEALLLNDGTGPLRAIHPS